MIAPSPRQLAWRGQGGCLKRNHFMNDHVALIADICAILLFLSVVFSAAKKFYKRYKIFLNWQIVSVFLIQLGIIISLTVFLEEVWVSITVSVGMALIVFLVGEATGRLYKEIIAEWRGITEEAMDTAKEAAGNTEEALQMMRDILSELKKE